MKKGKLIALVLAGALSVSMLISCSDEDWADEEPVSQETVEESEEDTDIVEESDPGDTADGGKVAYVASGEAGVMDESVELASGGFVMGMESALDENPTRAVRRSTKHINQTVGTMLDGTPLPEDFYMYRSILSEQYQMAYDQICQGLTNGDAEIVMNVAVPKEVMQDIYFSVTYDHPELFWVGPKFNFSYNQNGIVTTVKPGYYQGSPEAFKNDVDNNVNEALADMWALANDAEKVKYAHDYLTSTITYQHNDMDQSAYTGFVWKQTVCAGYARCFAYMMHKMGIPCALLSGYAGEAHAWNLLFLDGEYYVMDVTWDDPTGAQPNTYYYNYYNITDAQVSKDHTRGYNGLNISCNLPQATGTRCNFQNYFGGNAYGTNFDAIQGVMPEHVSTNGDDGYGNYGYDDDESGYSDDYGNDDYYNNPDYYEYDDYGDESDWWNLLDPSWTQDDWAYTEEGGYWYIYDEATGYIYLYLEEEGVYGAMTEDDQENVYWLNAETGEWELGNY